MVQVLTDPTSPIHTPQGADEVWRSSTPQQTTQSHGLHPMPSREEHAQRMRELMQKRGMMRAPRRGWSLTDYQGEHDISSMLQAVERAAQSPRPAPIPENGLLASPAIPAAPATTPMTPMTPINSSEPQAIPLAQAMQRRPKLPKPRRSYTVMDYEPMLVNQPRPSGKLTLLDLPSELHYLFFDFLDPIDAVCFGLAHSRLYDIHLRKYGKVSLSSRYTGPNDREWAWRSAGPLVGRGVREEARKTEPGATDLKQMKVKGQVYCRKCGVSRCELHRHLRDWMGEGYEYCEIKQIFGQPAGPDAKVYCYMSSPKNPNRCGRHGPPKKSVPAVTATNV